MPGTGNVAFLSIWKVKSAPDAHSTSGSTKRRTRRDNKTRLGKRACREKEASNNVHRANEQNDADGFQTCFTVLEGRARRREILYVSLLPMQFDQNGTVQSVALGQFVPCSYEAIIYSPAFFSSVLPRTLVIVYDSRITLRNMIYNEFSTPSDSFLDRAQRFISSSAARSAELGQPIELGKHCCIVSTSLLLIFVNRDCTRSDRGP